MKKRIRAFSFTKTGRVVINEAVLNALATIDYTDVEHNGGNDYNNSVFFSKIYKPTDYLIFSLADKGTITFGDEIYKELQAELKKHPERTVWENIANINGGEQYLLDTWD